VSPISCMLCGAAGSRELFLSILAIFLFMFAGSVILLVQSILGGAFGDVASRGRPLEAEAEAARSEAQRD